MLPNSTPGRKACPTVSKSARASLSPLALRVLDLLDAEPSAAWTLRRLALQLTSRFREVTIHEAAQACGELLAVDAIEAEILTDRTFYRASYLYDAEVANGASHVLGSDFVTIPPKSCPSSPVSVIRDDQASKLRELAAATGTRIASDLFAGVAR